MAVCICWLKDMSEIHHPYFRVRLALIMILTSCRGCPAHGLIDLFQTLQPQVGITATLALRRAFHFLLLGRSVTDFNCISRLGMFVSISTELTNVGMNGSIRKLGPKLGGLIQKSR